MTPPPNNWYNPWTDLEDEILIEAHPFMTYQALADHLNRSYRATSVRIKGLRKMGLIPPHALTLKVTSPKTEVKTRSVPVIVSRTWNFELDNMEVRD